MKKFYKTAIVVGDGNDGRWIPIPQVPLLAETKEEAEEFAKTLRVVVKEYDEP